MQAESEPLNLEKLAFALTQPGMPSQTVIGAGAGVSQSTVSRAISGLIGETRGAELLWAYVRSRPILVGNKADAPKSNPNRRRTRPRKPRPQNQLLKQAALQRLQAYLDDEFDPELIIEQIGVLRRAQRANVRGRKARGISQM